MPTSHEVIATIAREGLHVLVIGGQALPAYGVVRHTTDLDCLLAGEDLQRLDARLREAGYAMTAGTGILSRYEHPDRGEVPPHPPSRLTYDEFIAWNTAQILLLAESGLLEQIRNDPDRRPVPVPFVLRKPAP